MSQRENKNFEEPDKVMKDGEIIVHEAVVVEKSVFLQLGFKISF